jgi:hypothetical protein
MGNANERPACCNRDLLPNDVVAEKCEQAGTCNVDQLSFKTYLSHWLAATSALLLSTAGTIMALLQASAGGAMASCACGPGSATCDTKSPTAGMGPRVLDSNWRRWRLSTACLPCLLQHLRVPDEALSRSSGLETASRFCLSLPLFYVFPYLAFNVAGRGVSCRPKASIRMRARWVDDLHFIAFLPLPPQPNMPIEIAHLVFMLSLVEVGFESRRQLRTYICNRSCVSRLTTQSTSWKSFTDGSETR